MRSPEGLSGDNMSEDYKDGWDMGASTEEFLGLVTGKNAEEIEYLEIIF